MNPDPSRALTILYTGHGKGKTTAAFGLALRMIGRGWKVLVLHFLKGPLPTGERLAAPRLAPELAVRTLGTGYLCLNRQPPAEQDRLAARRAWLEAVREVRSGQWNAVILDELNIMTSLGLIPVAEVLELIQSRPEHVTLVLTGRDADPHLIHAADIVTEMAPVRHVYNTGRADIEGIDR